MRLPSRGRERPQPTGPTGPPPMRFGSRLVDDDEHEVEAIAVEEDTAENKEQPTTDVLEDEMPINAGSTMREARKLAWGLIAGALVLGVIIWFAPIDGKDRIGVIPVLMFGYGCYKLVTNGAFGRRGKKRTPSRPKQTSSTVVDEHPPAITPTALAPEPVIQPAHKPAAPVRMNKNEPNSQPESNPVDHEATSPEPDSPVETDTDTEQTVTDPMEFEVYDVWELEKILASSTKERLKARAAEIRGGDYTPPPLSALKEETRNDILLHRAELKLEQERREAELQAEQERLAAAEAEHLAREQRKAAVLQSYRKESDLAPYGIFGFFQTKGGGGTTTVCVDDACTQSVSTQSNVMFMDTNPASGTGAARLGKDHGETLNVQEMVKKEKELKGSFRGFINLVRPNPYWVRAIGAESIVDETDVLLQDSQIKAIIQLAADNTEYLYIDTANVVHDSKAVAVMDIVDVPIFTAFVGVKDSLRQLGTTMESMRKIAGGKYKAKVDNGVVVITGLMPGDDIEKYRMYLNRVNLKDEIIAHQTTFNGPFLGIPHDPEIAKDTVINMEAWQPETRLAFQMLGIARLQQLREWRRLCAETVRGQLSEKSALNGHDAPAPGSTPPNLPATADQN